MGHGSLCSGADKHTNIVDIYGATRPGDYEFQTTVKDLLEICGHHEAEGEGKRGDNTEWDGLYWFMWNNANGDVTCTTKKIDVIVYSSKDVTLDPIEPTAVKSAETQLEIVSADYYNLMGVRSAAPVCGINIVRQTLSDGSVRTIKLLVK